MPTAIVLDADAAAAAARGREVLRDLGQLERLTADWAGRPRDTAKEAGFFTQVAALDAQYPGGLAAYTANARRLLRESQQGANPFEGCVPEVPTGVALDYGSAAFDAYEARGMAAIPRCAFVLVAGGLGERLGYGGIKLELPVQTLTDTCYLGYYIAKLDALHRAAGCGTDAPPLPLAIMTSGDTHEKTLALLDAHSWFGRSPESVILMKQEKVPSIQDNAGGFVKESLYALETKPHGHGDVHQLLHSTGVAARWRAAGREWVVFLQDTNAMAMHVSQAALGVSVAEHFEVNSICIPRKPGEAIGGIARLVPKDSAAPPVTINVEYNQLGPLLKAYNGVGDVAGADGNSPYPGNINTLVFRLEPYVANLEKTNGIIAEFVNPKYADAAKTTFKKPTRLECMMQDYPKLLPASSRVGFTAFSRLAAFSPVKNNTVDAAQKVKDGLDAGAAATAESDFYEMECARLRHCGVDVRPAATTVAYKGIPVRWWPQVYLHPSFAPTQAALKGKITGDVRIAPGSTLYIEGEDITIHNLQLDGALCIRNPPGAPPLRLRDLIVANKGWAFVPAPDAPDVPEATAIRGYVVKKDEMDRVVR